MMQCLIAQNATRKEQWDQTMWRGRNFRYDSKCTKRQIPALLFSFEFSSENSQGFDEFQSWAHIKRDQWQPTRAYLLAARKISAQVWCIASMHFSKISACLRFKGQVSWSAFPCESWIRWVSHSTLWSEPEGQISCIQTFSRGIAY